jgi:acetyl-CoA acetyltransferase
MLPVNNAGGDIAEGFVHGIRLVLEAVRQVRGTSAKQVPDADVCLCLSYYLASCSRAAGTTSCAKRSSWSLPSPQKMNVSNP